VNLWQSGQNFYGSEKVSRTYTKSHRATYWTTACYKWPL